MASRRDEEPKIWFRSDRVFRVDGDWFIHTREGIAVGPYADKFSADVDAEMLKSALVGVSEADAVQIIEDFMQSGGRELGNGGAEAVQAAEVASLLDDNPFDRVRELSR